MQWNDPTMWDDLPTAVRERFDALIDKSGPTSCWLWTGYVNPGGYGMVSGLNRTTYAHRLAYERWRGPLVSGMVVDHVCRIRHCTNPAHLEAVTNRENILRGVGATAVNARKTHCKRGHEFTPENTHVYQGMRRCRACWPIESRARSKGLRPWRHDLDDDAIVRRHDSGESFRSIARDLGVDHKVISHHYHQAKT
jgi:hypothetical protein